MDEAPFSWEDFAAIYPTFVQWIVQRYGGVPDGPIKREDYERYRAAYLERR